RPQHAFDSLGMPGIVKTCHPGDYDTGGLRKVTTAGGTWQVAADGLTVPWPEHMVERFFTLDKELVAVLSNGEVITRPVAGGKWQKVLNEAPGVNALAA
ncbi:MAG TPA: hypothetical protein VHO48_04315, partial [Anaerolineaceae bacterium]|nr:hypothetical protein [Anaerolineaceae bacterium]